MPTKSAKESNTLESCEARETQTKPERLLTNSYGAAVAPAPQRDPLPEPQEEDKVIKFTHPTPTFPGRMTAHLTLEEIEQQIAQLSEPKAVRKIALFAQQQAVEVLGYAPAIIVKGFDQFPSNAWQLTLTDFAANIQQLDSREDIDKLYECDQFLKSLGTLIQRQANKIAGLDEDTPSTFQTNYSTYHPRKNDLENEKELEPNRYPTKGLSIKRRETGKWTFLTLKNIRENKTER